MSARIILPLLKLRAQVRAEAEERRLDEVLNRLADAGQIADQDDDRLADAGQISDQDDDRLADAGQIADQDDDNPARLGADRGPLPPRLDPLFGLLIGVLGVVVLIAMLALLSLRWQPN
jgi:hypothetical protein